MRFIVCSDRSFRIGARVWEKDNLFLSLHDCQRDFPPWYTVAAMPGYRGIRKSLRAFLQAYGPKARRRRPPGGPSEAELLFELSRASPGNLLFGRYDEKQLLLRLQGAGILPGLLRRGYAEPLLRLSCADPADQRLCLFAGAPSRDRLLLEARFSLCRFSPGRAVGPFSADASFRTLILHWLVLSDPDRPFPIERPRLPGQERPGLGLLENAIGLLRDLARDLALDCVLNVPVHFHTALFYGRAFRFFDPEAEGECLAMARDLSGPPLALVSEAVSLGCLVDARTSLKREWRPAEQLLPARAPLRGYFRSTGYRARRDRAREAARWAIDWDAYRAKLAAAAASGKSS